MICKIMIFFANFFQPKKNSLNFKNEKNRTNLNSRSMITGAAALAVDWRILLHFSWEVRGEVISWQRPWRLIDWVQVIRPTQHKKSSFGDVPQASPFACYAKPDLTQLAFTNKKECTTAQNKHSRWDGQPFGHNSRWPKSDGAVPLFRGSWIPT